MAAQRSDTTRGLGLTLAILAGAAAVMLGRAPLAFVAPRACGGLPELGTLWLARLTPNLPVSAWVVWINSAVIFAGVAWTTRLAQKVSAHVLIGTAVGAAVAAWVASSPQFVLLRGAGPLLASAVFWSIVAVSPIRRLALWIPFAAAAALWPSSTIGCALAFIVTVHMTGALDWRALTGAGAIVLVGALAHLAATDVAPASALAACLATDLRPGVATNGLAVFSAAGPYACALAALGLFARGRGLGAWPLPALGLLLLSSPEASLSVAPVALGVGAAGGLKEAASACRRGLGGRLAAVLLVALLPALAWQSALSASRPSPDTRTFGHGRLSLALMRRLVSAIPPGARVLSEDATTDLIVRATRRGAGAMVSAGDADRLADTLARGVRAFALPLGQREVGQLGFRLDDLLPGMAEVRTGTSCRIATSEWRRLGDLDATELTLAARSPDEAGPVVVYAAFDTRPQLEAVEWPQMALRGFYTTIYDLRSDADRAHLTQDVSDDGAPAEPAQWSRPFMTRLELWRTPNAPLRLTVALGAPPQAVTARVIAKAGPRRLWLCPSYPHVVRSFAD